MILRFLRKILPAREGIVHFGLSITPGGAHTQKPYGDHESLIGQCVRWSGVGRNTFFSLAGYGQGKRRGKDNAEALRSLFLDVDCVKPGAQYPTLEDGRAALDRFVSELALPDPLIVRSGQGMHVYWPLTRDLAPVEWLPLAGLLARAAARQGFRVDAERTESLVTMPRLPGTIYYGKKGEFSIPVKILRDAGPSDPVCLEALLEDAGGPRKPVLEWRPEGGPPYLGDHGPRDRDPVSALRECRQLREAGRPGASHRSWLLMLAVMRHCRDGLRAAHAVSRHDPSRYDPADLESQFGSVGSYGPVRCETFMRENALPCRGCRWLGRVRSPVMTVPERLDPPPEEDVPEGLEPFRDEEFEVVPGQGLYHKVVPRDPGRDKPFQILINESEFYVKEVCSAADADQERRSLRFRVRGGPGRAWREVTLRITEDFGGAGFGTWLANHGLYPYKSAYVKLMVAFMGSYIASIQNRTEILESRTHFGWVGRTDPDTGERGEALAVGSRLYTGAPAPERAALDRRCSAMAVREYTVSGDLEGWRGVPMLYETLGQPEAQLYMCASFAAPYMRLGPGTAKNLILCMWDERGGKGKSTLLQAVNTVWGHPVNLTCSKSDSLSARFQVLSARRNLPFCMDELTTMHEAEMSSLLFDVANGMERRKSVRSGEGLMDTGRWETVTFLTSNRSIYELMQRQSGQTKADSMRVLELPCNFRNYAGTPEARLIESAVELMARNHGTAGPAFVNDLLARPGSEGGLAAEARRFSFRVQRSSEERFWTYGLGMILAAGRKAAELGYLPYDVDRLERWAERELLPRLRGQVNESAADPMALLGSYLNANIDRTLAVKDAGPGGGGEGGDAAYVRRWPRQELRVRHEIRHGTLYVDAAHFKEWCARFRLSPSAILDFLSAEGVWDGSQSPKVLAEGVPDLVQSVTVCLRLEPGTAFFREALGE